MVIKWKISGKFFVVVTFLLTTFSSLCFSEEGEKVGLEEWSKTEEIKISMIKIMSNPMVS